MTKNCLKRKKKKVQSKVVVKRKILYQFRTFPLTVSDLLRAEKCVVERVI